MEFVPAVTKFDVNNESMLLDEIDKGEIIGFEFNAQKPSWMNDEPGYPFDWRFDVKTIEGKVKFLITGTEGSEEDRILSPLGDMDKAKNKALRKANSIKNKVKKRLKKVEGKVEDKVKSAVKDTMNKVIDGEIKKEIKKEENKIKDLIQVVNDI